MLLNWQSQLISTEMPAEKLFAKKMDKVNPFLSSLDPGTFIMSLFYWNIPSRY